MDTVFNLPFTFKVETEYYNPIIQEGINFYDTDKDLLEREVTASIEENDNVSILFNSENPDSRLYLEALDILPDNVDVEIDEEGSFYRLPSPELFPLYQQGNDFDALRVEKFKILVVCNQKYFYGVLEVKPKQLNVVEWQIMKEDLENEITGLAQDIVRRNIGLGIEKEGNQPPEKLQKFLTIKKHSKAVMNALIDIKDKPKFEIKKEYVKEDSYKAKEIDYVSIKKSLKNPQLQDQVFVPRKYISYDIQENRLLKNILQIYEQELKSFTSIINNMIEHYNSSKTSEYNYPNIQYTKAYISGLNQFLESAQKLARVTNIVKSQNWFKDISQLSTGTIPHSFVLDSRYGTIYKMYRELVKDEFSVELDPQYSYSWKKSSELYEMWCYLKICHAFLSKYNDQTDWLTESNNGQFLFPFLKKGNKMTFDDEEIRIDVIYDELLPRRKEESKKQTNPFYLIGQHFRPDTIINLYYKKKDMYIGSIVLESKYRKIKNFWYGSTQSSKSQIQEYYEDSRSKYFYNDVSKNFDIRPVTKVIVLTPDELGNNKRAKEDKIIIKTLKPNQDNYINDVFELIQSEIKERLSVAETI